MLCSCLGCILTALCPPSHLSLKKINCALLFVYTTEIACRVIQMTRKLMEYKTFIVVILLKFSPSMRWGFFHS